MRKIRERDTQYIRDYFRRVVGVARGERDAWVHVFAQDSRYPLHLGARGNPEKNHQLWGTRGCYHPTYSVPCPFLIVMNTSLSFAFPLLVLACPSLAGLDEQRVIQQFGACSVCDLTVFDCACELFVACLIFGRGGGASDE